jgi:hypothetical protein
MACPRASGQYSEQPQESIVGLVFSDEARTASSEALAVARQTVRVAR